MKSSRGLKDDPPLEHLTAVSRALTYARSLEEVLEITVDNARDLLDAPRAVLMLEDDEDRLRIRAARGVEPEKIEEFGELLDETVVSRLDAVFGPGARERFLGVPLVVRGRVRGLLAVLRSEGRDAERDQRFLSALADQASVALDGARHEEESSGLKERLESSEAQEKGREQALQIVGHDMRSPLNAMRGYVELLREELYGPLNEDQKRVLKRLGSVTEHLDSLVGNALEMSRIQAGQVSVTCEAVALGRVVDEALEIVELQAEERDVVVSADVPAELEVRADGSRLRQVLIQLLDNAIKHSPVEGVVRVEATPEAAAGSAGWVAIRVSDQGPGIDEEDVEAIFEPYRRVGDADTGSGLGLAIARAMVELMDGKLELEDSGTAGATFAIRLPSG